MAKSEVAKNGNIVGRAFNKIGYGFLWTGAAVGRISTIAVAAVPGAAFTAEFVNAFSRAIKGHDIAPSYIESVHTAVDPMLQGSALSQQVGLGIQACLASAEIAGTVGRFGGDVAGVIASHTGEHESAFNTVGRVAAHSVVAGAAGYAAVKVLEIPIPRPSHSRT